MTRRGLFLTGTSAAVLLGAAAWWFARQKKPNTPTVLPDEPSPSIAAPNLDDATHKSIKPVAEPQKPATKVTSIREGLPKSALALESPQEAIARGTGLPWRKKNLKAVVTPDKWLAVEPLSQSGFAARSGASIIVSDSVLKAHIGGYALAQGPVVFAIRGARPSANASGFSDMQSLTITPPDHLNFCCTIGVWDPETGLVSAYAGSTVPNRTAIVSSALGIQPANMRLPGINTYVPGAHSNYKKYGFPFSIIGALRQNGSLPVLRATTPTGMAGATKSSTTDDNLHCAETPLLEPYDRFSSEGCMVVAGRYTPREGHTGPWAAFLKDAKFKGRSGVTLVLVNSTDLPQV